MTVIFSEAFTRADNDSLGANWLEMTGTDWDIFSNQLRLVAATTTPGNVSTTTTAHAAIANCEVSVKQVTNPAGFDAGPVARATDVDSAPTLYMCDCYGTVMECYRHNNSATGTLVGTGQTITLATNTTIKIKVTGAGATVTIDMAYGGTTKTVTDSSASRLTAAGQTGIISWLNAAIDWDDFSVDDLVGAAANISFKPYYDKGTRMMGPGVAIN